MSTIPEEFLYSGRTGNRLTDEEIAELEHSLEAGK